jgi:hypothetical protein
MLARVTAAIARGRAGAAAMGLALMLAGVSPPDGLAAPDRFPCPALSGERAPVASEASRAPGRQGIECRYSQVTVVAQWVVDFAPDAIGKFCEGDWLRSRDHTDLAEISPSRAAAAYVDTYYAARPSRWPRADVARVRTAMLRWAEQRAGRCDATGLVYTRARYAAAADRLALDRAGPVHVLRVDLTRVRLEPWVSGRSGDAAWPWVKQPVAALAAAFNEDRPAGAERAVAAINGGFFGPIGGPTGKSYSRVFTSAGPQVWQTAAAEAGNPDRQTRMQARMELRIPAGPVRAVSIEPGDTNDPAPPAGALVLGGGGRLLPTVSSPRTLRPAVAPDPEPRLARPRTALGFASARPGVVFLVTVDAAAGVDIETLSRLMRQAGAPGPPLDQAMAFDGGGSTQMWIDGRGVVSANDNPRARVPGRGIVSALLVVGRARSPSP